VKAVVTSLEEEAALARSQQMESDRRCTGERFTISSFRFFGQILSLMLAICFWAELLAEVESLRDAADILVDFVRAPVGHRYNIQSRHTRPRPTLPRSGPTCVATRLSFCPRFAQNG
jgi:hypothetical protein